MVHVVAEALIVGAILLIIYNVLALPTVCVLWALGVEDSQPTARALVGALGALMLIAFLLRILAIA